MAQAVRIQLSLKQVIFGQNVFIPISFFEIIEISDQQLNSSKSRIANYYSQ